MHSMDIINDNVKKIAQLFPECITEVINDDNELEKVVDFDKLKALFSSSVVEGKKERYQFTWPDKSKAMALVNQPINATLRPCREESVNFDTTENLYIEGDNLDVLKLLRETYYGKIKMIYIDPPYNTGNDFVYEDDFSQDVESYKSNSGQYDDQGNRLQKNQESNGRFHTDWLNMMYPRLKIARDLLTEDGVIFISIDDNEQQNMRSILDNEVFGENNRVGTIVWKKKTNGNNMGDLPPVHDYIFCYAKNLTKITDFGYPISEEDFLKGFSNPDNDPRGPWTTTDLSANHKGPYFPIKNPATGEEFYPPKGRYWVFNEEEVKKRINDGRIIFGKSGNAKPVQKVFASSRVLTRKTVDSWWDNHGLNEDATEELSLLFDNPKLFSHPKPTQLIYNLINISTSTNDYILDFFSGSATTAHAVMKLNAKDGGHRKFIMVQIPENCDENKEAYKAGYRNICEIGKERIRRAGKKILEEKKAGFDDLFSNDHSDLDIGFRVLKLDSSNMTDVYYKPDELNQDELTNLISNIKEGRIAEDLLFQVMLELGILLSSKIETIYINGKTVFNVNEGYLMACFDEEVDEETIIEVAKKKPQFFVMRSSSMTSDSMMVNFDQIFDRFSPETTRKVI